MTPKVAVAPSGRDHHEQHVARDVLRGLVLADPVVDVELELIHEVGALALPRQLEEQRAPAPRR